MLTDIFTRRYENLPLWKVTHDTDRVLLVQCFRNLAEQVIPYRKNGSEDKDTAKIWKEVESRLSMELGFTELSSHTYGYYNSHNFWVSGSWSMDKVCKEWFLSDQKVGDDVDRFMKDRVSFIELAFKTREQQLSKAAYVFEELVRRGTYAGLNALNMRQGHADSLTHFRAFCDELNQRFS